MTINTTPEKPVTRPELLAPAGSHDALLAALSAGADAVYLGVEDFNARRNAANFQLDRLTEVCDLVHLAGRRLYLTLNTLVLPDETAEALEVARQAWYAGVDAVIVSDLGLLDRLATELPQLELHASTQMNLHSGPAVRQAARLGASRVTLSRELSLEQIAQIAQEGVPLEVFAHGALCVCYSGQCLFSSLVGRRSANRGLCAQACRLPYRLIDTSTGKRLKAPGEHLLSPADLATIDILPQLVASGITSLKIEGRMKSAAYVATVTRVYREALDGPASVEGMPQLTRVPKADHDKGDGPFCHDCEGLQAAQIPRHCEERSNASDVAIYGSGQGSVALTQRNDKEGGAHEILSETFSRGFTTAYLEGDRTNSMMSYARPNNQGVAVGRIAALDKGLVALALTKRVTQGDLLEIRTSRGRATVTLENFWASSDTKKPPLTEAAEETRIWLRIPDPVSPGDRVFRIRNAELQDEAESHYNNTLFQGNNGLVDLHAQVTAHLNHPLTITFTTDWDGAHDKGYDKGDGPFCHMLVTPGLTRGLPSPSQDDNGCRPNGLPSRQASPIQGTASGDPLQPARTKALTPEDIREHVGRVGGTPFSIASWDIQLDEGVGLGFSQLHSLRTQALEDLTENLLQPWRQRRLTKRDDPPALAPAQKGKPRVAAIVRDAASAKAAVLGGAELIYLHYLTFEAESQPDANGSGGNASSPGASPKRLPTKVPIVALLPAITHDSELPPLLASLKNRKAAVANNLAQVELLADTLDSLEAGPSLGIGNQDALALAVKCKLSQAWLSPELSYQDIAHISPTAPLPLALTIVGRQELMVTEHCLLMAQGPCDQRCATCARRKAPRLLEDRKGYLFPLRTDQAGRSHLFNSVPLDLVPSMPEIVSLGISTLVVDGTLMTTKELRAEVERATRARDLAVRGAGSLPKHEGQTTGHFFRGVW